MKGINIAIALLSLLSLVSCSEKQSPIVGVDGIWYNNNPISGKWAKIDSDQMAREYIELGGGKCRRYVSSDKRMVHYDMMWNSSSWDFSLQSSEQYSVVDGNITVGSSISSIQIVQDTMYVMGGKYQWFEGFSAEDAVVVNISPDYYEDNLFDYEAGGSRVEIEIRRPFKNDYPKVSTSDSWIHLVSQEGEEWGDAYNYELWKEDDGLRATLDFYFSVDENTSTSGRTGSILVEVPGAKPLTIRVEQEGRPKVLDGGSILVPTVE